MQHAYNIYVHDTFAIVFTALQMCHDPTWWAPSPGSQRSVVEF